MNLVIVKGNLTDDPREITGGGVAFAVASNERVKDKEGNYKDFVTFINCLAFGGIAGTIKQYFTKGKPILFTGKLAQSAKTKNLFVSVYKFEFIGGNEGAKKEEVKEDTVTDDIPF